MSKILDSVLEMVQAGLNVQQISEKLGISPQNVSARLSELRKLEYDVPRFKPGTNVEYLESRSAELTREAMIEACAAHLSDLEAVYQRPVSKVRPEGAPRFYPSEGGSASFCSSAQSW